MDFSRLFDLPYFQLNRFPTKKSLSFKPVNQWIQYSTEDLIFKVNCLSKGLLKMNVIRGAKIGILSHNGNPIWNIIDFACQQIGAIPVPIHSNFHKDELNYIIDLLDLDLCFVSNQEMLDRIPPNTEMKLFSMTDELSVPSWNTLCIDDAKWDDKLEELKASIKPSDLATILFTSGSTGRPKGVMLSHHNIVSNVKSIIPLIPINYKCRTASFLPLSHIFERMVVYTYIAVGCQLFYINEPKDMLRLAKEIRPNYMTSVPRILEKVYEGIHRSIEEKSLLTRKVISWAIKKGEKKKDRSFHPIEFIKIQLADILVYRRWRNLMGGRIKGIGVGAASLQPHLAKLYSTAGIPIREGYGLTETSPVISLNRFEAGGNRYGTVGITIPSVEVRIAEQNEKGEGEIQVKGPNVMLGYYKDPEGTAEKFTEDGWFKTGDIGSFEKKRFLKITDRRKNIFKTSSGRYVAPQVLENELRSNSFVDQVMIIGFQKPFISSLIIPNFELLKRWAQKEDIHWTAPQFMVLNDRVIKHFQEIIDSFNESYKNHERVKEFTLLFEPWSVTTGEYTPTLKLRRNVILAKYEKEIAKMYAS